MQEFYGHRLVDAINAKLPQGFQAKWHAASSL